MASITTVRIPKELQRMLLERCTSQVSLIGRVKDPNSVHVLAAVQTQRLGEYVSLNTSQPVRQTPDA
jgi:hypothetical protein